MDSPHIKLIAMNRKARHDYFIEDQYEAGLVLLGSEVKSIRAGKANLKDSYGKIRNGELFLYQMHISEYSHAANSNHDPLRPRKLLFHKREIKRLIGKLTEKGLSLIPTELYFKNGKVKVTIAIARGKKKYDKREAIRKRDEKKEMDNLKRRR